MQIGTLIYTFADIMIILRMKNLVQEAAVPLTLVQKVVNNRQPKWEITVDHFKNWSYHYQAISNNYQLLDLND